MTTLSFRGVLYNTKRELLEAVATAFLNEVTPMLHTTNDDLASHCIEAFGLYEHDFSSTSWAKRNDINHDDLTDAIRDLRYDRLKDDELNHTRGF